MKEYEKQEWMKSFEVQKNSDEKYQVKLEKLQMLHAKVTGANDNLSISTTLKIILSTKFYAANFNWVKR